MASLHGLVVGMKNMCKLSELKFKKYSSEISTLAGKRVKVLKMIWTYMGIKGKRNEKGKKKKNMRSEERKKSEEKRRKEEKW